MLHYKGWRIFDYVPVVGRWKAVRHGVMVNADTLEKLKRIIDDRPLSFVAAIARVKAREAGS